MMKYHNQTIGTNFSAPNDFANISRDCQVIASNPDLSVNRRRVVTRQKKPLPTNSYTHSAISGLFLKEIYEKKNLLGLCKL